MKTKLLLLLLFWTGVFWGQEKEDPKKKIELIKQKQKIYDSLKENLLEKETEYKTIIANNTSLSIVEKIDDIKSISSQIDGLYDELAKEYILYEVLLSD